MPVRGLPVWVFCEIERAGRLGVCQSGVCQSGTSVSSPSLPVIENPRRQSLDPHSKSSPQNSAQTLHELFQTRRPLSLRPGLWLWFGFSTFLQQLEALLPILKFSIGFQLFCPSWMYVLCPLSTGPEIENGQAKKVYKLVQ